jgi:sugar phosphate isomerase/epimerase
LTVRYKKAKLASLLSSAGFEARQTAPGDAHPRVSVSSFCSVSLSFEGDLALWRELGIRHVGLNVGKVEAAGWEAAATAVRAASLAVSTVAGPAPAETHASSVERHDQDELTRRGIEFASAVGAPCLYLVTGGAGRDTWEEAATKFAETVAPLRDHGREHGVTVAIEPTNPLRADISFVFSLRDAVRLARDADVGVVVELQACWLEPAFAATVAQAGDRISLVQVSDFVVGTTDTPNRAVPGDGDVPLERLLGTILDSGYQGPFDLEILGPRVEAEGYPSVIGRSVHRLSDLLERLGA